MNGTLGGFFKPGKGISQLDTLSPYLFFMVAEVLGCNIISLSIVGKIQGVKLASTLPSSNLQQFVDDTFFFGKSLLLRLENGRCCLTIMLLPQANVLTMEKVEFSFSTLNSIFKLKPWISMAVNQLAFLAPIWDFLTIKEVTLDFWNSVLEKTQWKLGGWKGKFLSGVGKLQFCFAFLQGIPIYFLSLFEIVTSHFSSLN